MRSFETSPSSSSCNSSCEDNEELTPTQLLSLAIKKRRALYESKDRDYRRELLHTGMIQTLCKYLGEGRALRRRSRRKRRSSHSQKRSHAMVDDNNPLPKAYQVSNEQLENMDQPHQKPEPTMLELNGDTDDGDDAVVPSVKRPKIEQVFEQETEEDREIIKEYGLQDFFSSLVSFYTPEYCTSVEPTKDHYWCSPDTDTDYGMPPDFELLALCS